ncbi:MAG: serine/threonine protein kinase [Lachnospiraceae bacterium]|nr:serine/threonine protein kinase [Lachnospiraceae bacterium]
MNPWSDETPLSLPNDLAAVYEMKSCLKYSAGSGTYLLRKKDTGLLYLLKTASDPEYAVQLKNEQKLLDVIHAQKDSWYPEQFPSAILLKSDAPDGEVFYIRTYIEGRTLEDLCETNYGEPGIPLTRSLDYLIALTELLRFLHSMTPPLIHRDIKPQNVIVDPDGGCHIIDLGISRFYQPNKRNDTLVMGTQLTAPPEQFGYRQCDVRSDLYSLGIVLLYCLTGEYTPEEALLAELDEPVARIIRRATMFDPDRRYQSADEMLSDLLAVRFPQIQADDGDRAEANGRAASEAETDREGSVWSLSHQKNHRFSKAGIAAIVCLCILLVAAAVWMNQGSHSALTAGSSSENAETTGSVDSSASSDSTGSADSTDSSDSTGSADSADSTAFTDDADSADRSVSTGSTLSEDAIYTFTEPLIEEAVRSQLGMDDTETITEKDLEKVTSLHIIGLQIYSDDEEIWFQGDYPYVYDDEMRESGLYEQTGTISSLEDLTHMPNLQTLCLYRQQISDISVLADGSFSISELGIGYNPLTDLSPLEGNATIRSLNLAGLEISDITVIATMENLKSLNISSTGVRSLAGLESCALEELNIFDVDLSDYTPLSSLEHLVYLEADHLTDAAIVALSKTSLISLFVHHLSSVALGQISALSTLESLGVVVGNMAAVSLDSIDLPALQNLDIKDATIADFQGLASLEALSTLKIYSSTCLSYDGLDEIPNLQNIQCTQEQAAEILAQYPDADFYYIY